MTSHDFIVERWSIEGHITKMAERIVMDFGLLILHKTKVLILLNCFQVSQVSALDSEMDAMKVRMAGS